jgi:predicted RNA-binding Zn-ribbon protein involved in translation (DUF1610 family)
MAISFSCHQCGQKLKAPDNAAGKSSKCPGCGTTVTCPEAIYEAELVETPRAKHRSVDPYADLDSDHPYGVVKPASPPSPETEDRRPCPMCGEMIVATAAKCRFCGEILDTSLRKKKKKQRKGEANTGRRILFGVVWTIVFYFVACMVTGGVIGAQVGSENPGNPNVNELIQARVQQTVLRVAGYIFLGSAVVAGLGAWARVLPGTRPSE